ncbi:MAG: DUF937 domain-containing protein [Gammaproteobacteria bacterium]|nr:DUF937 domain-containing protein [Gammaproteobacteria bacterium]MDH5311867.1 DUF937 domain-containing protein [Gammaproteobacteria bacterium]
MQITEILNQLGGLRSVAKELGVDEAQVTAGAAALMPALLGGFKKQAQAQPSGLDGLVGMLGNLGGGGLLDDVLSPQPTNVGRGNDVLGQIFGSPEVSRTVARNAAATSGIDPALLKKMLPMLAMLVAGFMAKQSMGQPAAPASGAAGGLGGLLGGLLGQGGASKAPGLAGMLDLNGDGNPLDDILGLASKFLR